MVPSSGRKHRIWAAAGWAGLVAIAAAGFLHLETLNAGAERASINSPTLAASELATMPVSLPSVPSVVEIPAGRAGQFRTSAQINGQPVSMMVDTGATMVALSFEDAQRAGVQLSADDFTQSVATANGTARIALVMLETIRVGTIHVRQVPAAVSEPGRLKTSLLGLTFLDRLSQFDMGPDLLILRN